MGLEDGFCRGSNPSSDTPTVSYLFQTLRVARLVRGVSAGRPHSKHCFAQSPRAGFWSASRVARSLQ
jgi:hypothetical protein